MLTNIGKSFLSLLNKHFPPNHRYHKIFNRQTVKLSYSCSQCQINYNAAQPQAPATKPPDPSNQPGCNCRKKDLCPLSGKCLESAMIYKATVSSKDEEKFILEQQSKLSRNVTQTTRIPSIRRIPTLQPACQLMFGVLTLFY